MTFRLAIYTAWSGTSAALLRRERMPTTYRTAGEAAAAGVAYLQAHAQAIGFEVEPPGLEAANDAAMTGRTTSQPRLIATRATDRSTRRGAGPGRAVRVPQARRSPSAKALTGRRAA